MRAGVRGELLAEADRHRILQVRAAGLHDVVELPALRGERVAQRLERRHERVELRQAREPDVRGNRVVGALRHVDVIVRMHRRVRRRALPPRISFARFASTSFTFMLCDVPAPAWYGSTMNCVVVLAGEHFVGGLR